MSDGSRERPRPKARVVIDPDNAYARLGVSPLSSLDEIKQTLRERGNKLRRAARMQEGEGETEALARLQAIEDEIGSAKARLAYDQRHPQNELLTVQPSPRDRFVDTARRAELVGRWVLEELGPEARVLTAAAPAWWMPGGVSDALREALAPYVTEAAPAAVVERGALGVSELDGLMGRTTGDREES